MAFKLAESVELTMLGAARRGFAGVAGVRAPLGVAPADPGREGGLGREALSRCRLFMGNFVLDVMHSQKLISSEANHRKPISGQGTGTQWGSGDNGHKRGKALIG